MNGFHRNRAIMTACDLIAASGGIDWRDWQCAISAAIIALPYDIETAAWLVG